MIKPNIDPLSEATRKERKALLLSGVLGIFFTTTEAIPKNIPFLGIESGDIPPEAFLYLFAAVLSYFCFAFFVYALQDFSAWRKTIYQQKMENVEGYVGEMMYELEPQDQFEALIEDERRQVVRNNKYVFKIENIATLLRAAFDFGLPILFGGWSLIQVIAKANLLAN